MNDLKIILKIPCVGTVSDSVIQVLNSDIETHRILMTRFVAEQALHTFLYKPITYKPIWTGHMGAIPCGVITSARIMEEEMILYGYIWDKAFPDVADFLKENGGVLGCSFVSEGRVWNTRSKIWSMKQISFTELTLMFKKACSYKNSSVEVLE